MSPRPTLTLLTGAIAVLCLVAPAFAEEDAGLAAGATPAPKFEYAAPLATKNPVESGKDEAETTPSKRRMPPPSGCPFRQGDLELIV